VVDLGYDGLWLWRPLAMADQNLTKSGLVPLLTSDQSPQLQHPSDDVDANIHCNNSHKYLALQ